MAIKLDSSLNAYIEISDDAALTLPDGDWTMAIWFNLQTNAGNRYQYPISWAAFNVTPSFNVFIKEASTGGSGKNALQYKGRDDDGSNMGGTYGATDIGTKIDQWQHLCIIRDGNNLDVYMDGSSYRSFTSSLYDAVNPALSILLGRGTGTSDYADMTIEDFAKWDRALSSDELAMLVSGFSSRFFHPDYCLDLISVDQLESDFSPLTVTNNKGTTADGQGLVYPGSPKIPPGMPAQFVKPEVYSIRDTVPIRTVAGSVG